MHTKKYEYTTKQLIAIVRYRLKEHIDFDDEVGFHDAMVLYDAIKALGDAEKMKLDVRNVA